MDVTVVGGRKMKILQVWHFTVLPPRVVAVEKADLLTVPVCPLLPTRAELGVPGPLSAAF